MAPQIFRKAFQRSVLNRANPYEYTDAMKNVKEIGGQIGNHLKTNYNPKDPWFKKDEEGRNLNNLWSGYKLGGKGKILTTGSLLAGGTIIAGNPRSYQNAYNESANTQVMSEEQDVESLQSTRADGLGYQAQIGNSQLISASGDLVFAMHKTRHTGQF